MPPVPPPPPMLSHVTPPPPPVWYPQQQSPQLPAALQAPRPPPPSVTLGPPVPRPLHPHNKPHFQSPAGSGRNGSSPKKTALHRNGTAPPPPPSRMRSDRPKQCRAAYSCKPDNSHVMQEFRRIHARFELDDIRGYVLEFARDRHGSRFIQQKLERVDADEKQMIFDELTPEIYPLMNDKYGNYVIQKYFEFGSDEQKLVLVEKLQGNVLYLTLEVYGCRVIQKAIETLPPEFQV